MYYKQVYLMSFSRNFCLENKNIESLKAFFCIILENGIRLLFKKIPDWDIEGKNMILQIEQQQQLMIRALQ